ncbi:ATP-binding protein [Streptomyces violascens]|uniref:ATP-binding protein n=1 Tax=Streptomyces violascens TaxID=67381 RepID=UPI00369AC2FE
MDVPFVGRGELLALLGQALDRARTGVPQRVLIEGPAGIGKTALVRRFLALADLPHVLCAAGEEDESGLAFGVLAQLLDDGSRTPGHEEWGDPSAAGADLLDALDKAQGDDGDTVAIAVDDAQWADHPSLKALTFALRRLRADRVVALVVVRDLSDHRMPEGLRRLCTDADTVLIRLEGLDRGELRLLARELGLGGLTAQAAARLHAHTAGNPLYARTLLEQGGPGFLDDLERLDATLPAPKPFGSFILARLITCTPETQALVCAASVLGAHCSLTSAAALAGQSDPLPALQQAVSVGLLTERPGDPVIRFPHPLVHAAVYHQLGPLRRAELHLRAAALADDGALALRHRARAAVGPDPGLARELAAVGRRLAAAGVWSNAAGQLSSAAELCADRSAYEQLTMEALECRLLAGDVPDVSEAAEKLHAFAASGWRSYLLGRLALFDLDRAEALLRDAWSRCDTASEPALGARIAGQFAALYGSMARGRDMAEWARTARGLAPEATATDMIRYLELAGAGMSGRAAEALPALEHLPHPAVASPVQLEELLGRGTLRQLTGDLLGATRDLTAVLDASHGRAASFRVVTATVLASAEYGVGRWDDSIARCYETVRLAADTDQPHIALYCRVLAALAHSARGAWEAAESQVAVIREYASFGHRNPVVWTALSEAHLARARGNPEQVVAALEPLLALGRRGESEEPGALHWPDLLADAWTALGAYERAEQALAPYAELAADRGHHGALALVARSRGVLAAVRGDTDDAKREFRAAHEHAAHTSVPFERGLLHLAHGQFLRRLGKRTRAGEQLRAARDLLLRLDARPDLERCERELAACGLAPGEYAARDASLLTPQELAVARRVAAGLSNRQVARELVISVKTVEYHLGRLYAKLGIDSRTRLAARLTVDNRLTDSDGLTRGD